MHRGFLLALLLGCSKPPSDTILYASPERGFSILFPKGWVIEEYAGRNDVVSSTDRRTGAVILVQVHTFRRTMTADAFYSEIVTNIDKKREFEATQQGTAKVNGTDAYWVMGSVRLEDGETFTLEYYFTRETLGYRVICTAGGGEFDKALPKFEAACLSFKFEGGP